VTAKPLLAPRTTGAPHNRVLRLARTVFAGLQARNAFEAAASIAFWFFLSLVPLLVLVGFLVGRAARAEGIDPLLEPLIGLVPGSAETIVRSELERLAGGSAASLAPLGIAGFLWTASTGLHNLMDVFEISVSVSRRPWWKQRAMALGWVACGLATAFMLAWVLVRVDAIVQGRDASVAVLVAPSSKPPQPGPAPSRATERPVARNAAAPLRPRGTLGRRVHKALHSPAEQAIAALLLLVAGMGLLAGFYRFAVEHPPGVRRRVWPGTATAVASWLLVSWAFETYAASIADYALFYGSLAAVAVLLVWLYLTSLALVLGAEVNAEFEGLRAGERHPARAGIS
jgi:membrane protein